MMKLLVTICWLCLAVSAAAQPNCLPKMLPELMAMTYTSPSWAVLRTGRSVDGAGEAIDPDVTYVVGLSQRYWRWVKDGIRFLWYPVPNVDDINGTTDDGHTPQAAFYVTLNKGDSEGINQNLSEPLQPNSAVLLEALMLYPYPEPIRIETQLHLRVCY